MASAANSDENDYNVENYNAPIEYITRSDNPGSRYPGTFYHPTFAAAYEAWQQDNDIWKISFQHNGIKMRWIPKTHNDIWENEDCLNNLSSEYANEQDSSRIYWIWQDIGVANCMDITTKLVNGEITNAEAIKLIKEVQDKVDRECIKEVMTNEGFANRFNNL